MKKGKGNTKVNEKRVEEKIVEETKVEEIKVEETKVSKKHKIYLSFGNRLVLNIVLLLVFVCLFICSFTLAFKVTNKEYINIKENSNVDYKIVLKDNNFYEEDFLDQGKVYVASLIDKINVDFAYNFYVDKKSDLDLKYRIVAKLVVASQQNAKEFFSKEYNISDEINDSMINSNQYVIIKKNVEIDYGYYNDLANSFKSGLAVNTDSKLEVSLQVGIKNKETNEYEFNKNSESTLVIPLSLQEVNISFDNKNLNNESQLINESKIVVKNIAFVAVCVVLVIAILFTLFVIFKKLFILLGFKRNNYDKYVNRILRGYDRLIISIKNLPSFEGLSMIKVESFQELIDLRDNTSQPINYYVITNHQKCEFFVIYNNSVYIYVVKKSDLDEGKIK